jgi:hypothetical protein
VVFVACNTDMLRREAGSWAGRLRVNSDGLVPLVTVPLIPFTSPSLSSLRSLTLYRQSVIVTIPPGSPPAQEKATVAKAGAEF